MIVRLAYVSAQYSYQQLYSPIHLERVRATRLDECSRERIAIAVALFREETDVVTLAGDHNGKQRNLLDSKLDESLFDIANFVFENLDVLAFTDTTKLGCMVSKCLTLQLQS